MGSGGGLALAACHPPSQGGGTLFVPVLLEVLCLKPPGFQTAQQLARLTRGQATGVEQAPVATPAAVALLKTAQVARA